MSKLDVRYVVRNRLLAFGGRHDLVCGNEQELCFRIDKPLDQPRTRDPVDVGIRARDPLHSYGLLSLKMDAFPQEVRAITLTREEGFWRRCSPWRPTALLSDIRPA